MVKTFYGFPSEFSLHIQNAVGNFGRIGSERDRDKKRMKKERWKNSKEIESGVNEEDVEINYKERKRDRESHRQRDR